MLATGSLRRAEPGERHLKGLTVAANPERYPNPYGLLRPQIADEFDGPVSENGKELPKRVADQCVYLLSPSTRLARSQSSIAD